MTFEDRQRVAMLDQYRSAWRPTWAQPAERRLYEIEQAAERARQTQRALLDHAKQGQLAPPDEGPDPLGR